MPSAVRVVPVSATLGIHPPMHCVLQLVDTCCTLVLPMKRDMLINYSYVEILCIYWMQPLPLCHVYDFVCRLLAVSNPYK